MKNKKKKIPVNSVGKIIKEARERQNLSIEELSWKINNPKITEDLIKDWEKGQEFPDLDCIYILAENLNLNPNELLSKRLTIQDESIHEINPATRRVGGKFLHAVFVVVKQCVKWIAGICIIVVVANYKHFENRIGGMSDPEQFEFVDGVITNEVNRFINAGSESDDVLHSNEDNTNTANVIENNTLKENSNNTIENSSVTVNSNSIKVNVDKTKIKDVNK